jgi:hypothetical protein
MPLEGSVVDSVSNSNFKNQGEMPTQFSNILLNDALIAGRNMTAIREKSVARSLERMDTTNDDEGVNAGTLNAAIVALSQQIMKGAQTTNPETGK